MDERNSHYDVEMQVLTQGCASQSDARYYHSQMDMELLAGGANDYAELPEHLCDFYL